MISIRTFTGRHIDLEAPTPEMFCIEDIAQGLSHCCRFAGQCETFYSVAQHAVLVSILVDKQYAWAALHHDDSEAYMGDLSRNLKHHPALAGYRSLEHQLSQVIGWAFGFSLGTACAQYAVKTADDLAAIYEHWTFRKKMPWDAEIAIDWAIDSGFVKSQKVSMMRIAHRLPDPYVPLPSHMARKWFLDRFAQLSVYQTARRIS